MIPICYSESSVEKKKTLQLDCCSRIILLYFRYTERTFAPRSSWACTSKITIYTKTLGKREEKRGSFLSDCRLQLPFSLLLLQIVTKWEVIFSLLCPFPITLSVLPPSIPASVDLRPLYRPAFLSLLPNNPSAHKTIGRQHHGQTIIVVS